MGRRPEEEGPRANPPLKMTLPGKERTRDGQLGSRMPVLWLVAAAKAARAEVLCVENCDRCVFYSVGRQRNGKHDPGSSNKEY